MTDRTFNIIAGIFALWMLCAFYNLLADESDIRDALAFVDGIKKLYSK